MYVRSGLAAAVAAAALVGAAAPGPAAAQQPSGWGQTLPQGGLEALQKRQRELSSAIYLLSRLIMADSGYFLLEGDSIPTLRDAGVPFMPVSESLMTELLVTQVLAGELEPEAVPGYIARLRRTTEDNRARARVKLAEMERLEAQTNAQIAALMRSKTPWAFGLPPGPSAPAGPAVEATGLAGERFGGVCTAIGTESCARMYADVSVILARYGARVGWINGMDPRAPPGDPGRGVLSWDAHYRHGVGPGMGRLAGPVAERLEDLHYALDPATEAQMEREVDGAINGYGPKS